jgi:cytochrome b561
MLGFSDQTGQLAALLRWVALMTHLALYAFLIALPLLGWAATSAKGVTLRLFALAPLPGLVAPDPDLADALVDYHMWGAWALLALVAAHAFAALWHHFVRRDGVLAAMLPNSRSPGIKSAEGHDA